MPPIVHVVCFGFKPTLETTNIQNACNRMIDLKEKCIHPATGKPYIKSAVGGRDNSPEGHQHGMTHGFVVEFENEEDRRYYLEEDPAHLAFVKSLDGVVNTVFVVDFHPVEFSSAHFGAYLYDSVEM